MTFIEDLKRISDASNQKKEKVAPNQKKEKVVRQIKSELESVAKYGYTQRIFDLSDFHSCILSALNENVDVGQYIDFITHIVQSLKNEGFTVVNYDRGSYNTPAILVKW